jgi:hypothetical protein
MCSVIILLTTALHDPEDPQASLNVEWIGKFVFFLQTFQNREECDLSSLIGFCSKLYDIASFAEQDPTDLVNNGEDDAEGLRVQYTVGLINTISRPC